MRSNVRNDLLNRLPDLVFVVLRKPARAIHYPRTCARRGGRACSADLIAGLDRPVGSAAEIYLTSTFAPASVELLLDRLGVGLVDAFLDVLRRAVDEVLGLLEAEVGDLADRLDDADLVGAGVGEDDRELGLLGGRSRRRRRRAPEPPPRPPEPP